MSDIFAESEHPVYTAESLLALEQLRMVHSEHRKDALQSDNFLQPALHLLGIGEMLHNHRSPPSDVKVEDDLDAPHVCVSWNAREETKSPPIEVEGRPGLVPSSSTHLRGV